MKYDMNNASSSNINNRNSIWKKAIRVGSVVLAPIPESLVKELRLDEEHTWFEEIPVRGGIFLKIVSKKIETSHDVNKRRGGQEKSLTKEGGKIRQTPDSRIRAEVC